MKKTALLLAVTGIMSAFTGSAFAGTHILTIGDKVPTLDVGGWVKGTPIASFDPNKTYVVEFWATWCGPCKESIPHLTEMAKEFKDQVTFTGVSAFESQKSDKDTAYIQTVKDFVTQMGDKMEYNVAYDTPDKFMAKNWMEAAAQPGIPTAFVIQKDHIIWIGHPMNLEDPLKQIVAGTYDEAKEMKAIKDQQAQQAVEMQFNQDLKAAMKSATTATKVKSAIASLRTKYPSQSSQLDNIEVSQLLKIDQKAGINFVNKEGAKNPSLYMAGAEGMLSGGKVKADYELGVTFAKKYLAQAKEPNDKVQTDYIMALCYDKAGDKASAASTMDDAIAVAKTWDNPNKDQIIAQLNNIKDSFTKSDSK